MREEFEIKRDRYQLSKPKQKGGLDDDDQLDDLINEKQNAMDAEIRREAERLAEKFDELDFDDIDTILESVDQKGKETDNLEELDDDQIDAMIAKMQEEKAKNEEQTKQQEKQQESAQDDFLKMAEEALNQETFLQPTEEETIGSTLFDDDDDIAARREAEKNQAQETSDKELPEAIKRQI